MILWIFLAILMIFVFFLIMYIKHLLNELKELIRVLNKLSEQDSTLYKEIGMYREFLQSILKMDMYTHEPTIIQMMKYTKTMEEFLKEYQSIYDEKNFKENDSPEVLSEQEDDVGINNEETEKQ